MRSRWTSTRDKWMGLLLALLERCSRSRPIFCLTRNRFDNGGEDWCDDNCFLRRDFSSINIKGCLRALHGLAFRYAISETSFHQKKNRGKLSETISKKAFNQTPPQNDCDVRSPSEKLKSALDSRGCRLGFGQDHEGRKIAHHSSVHSNAWDNPFGFNCEP